MPRAGLPWLAATLLAAAGSSHAAEDRFRQLDPDQIRTQVVGKAITDEAHWSDHFYRDGGMKSIELGETRRGSWVLGAKTLCITRPLKKGKSETECNEVWRSGNRVEYRRDGVTISEGVLKDQW